MPQPSIAPLAVPQPQSTTDQVFDALYQAVISLQLPPGTKVSEAEIAQQLKTSRQPVRDAFFRLSKLGFLEIRPQRATLITMISERAVLNAAFIRTAIEVECLKRVHEIGNKDHFARLQDHVDLQEAALADPDRDRFHALDEQFHRMICECAGHPHAWDLIREQKAHMDRIRFLTLDAQRRKLVVKEHLEIVRALTGREFTSVEGKLREHISAIRQSLSDVRARHDDLFAAEAT